MASLTPVTGSCDSKLDAFIAEVRRSSAVGVATGIDVAVNYPLWIAAKRAAVGVPAFPARPADIYKGGGVLWLSYGPTTMIEDTTKRFIQPALPAWLPNHDLLSAVAAGAVAGSFFCAQIEHVITAAHAKGTPMGSTISTLYRRVGVRGLALPPGMLMTACREVPFVTSLFYVHPRVTSAVYGELPARGEDGAAPKHARKAHLEVAAAVGTSAITCPISHMPSMVQAYQQGHGVGVRQAIREIYSQGGFRSFWRGFWSRTASLSGTLVVVPLGLALFGEEGS